MSTLEFGPDRAAPVHEGHFEDVNDDGFTDLVTHYRQKDTGIASGDSEASLTGMLLDGTPIGVLTRSQLHPALSLLSVRSRATAILTGSSTGSISSTFYMEASI